MAHGNVINSAKDIGGAIREARKARSLTQVGLARSIGTSQNWVSEIENGKETAEIGLVLRAIKFLGLEIRLQYPLSPAPSSADLADDPFDEDFSHNPIGGGP